MAGQRKYSCQSAAETLEWIHAIIDFIRPYGFFLEAHVVNFFKDRLWEAVDKGWIDSLRNESVENLLQIPSGVVQDCWPPSLKEFILTLSSLALPREEADLLKVLPDLHMTSLNNVLAQGMNWKKKHEVESLAAVVSSIARSVDAKTIIDVGAGQGYLAQVLSFEYQLSVIAIDACSNHGTITNARAQRIRKHYAAKMRKSRSGDTNLNIPKIVTCSILSTDSLKAVTLSRKDDVKQPTPFLRSLAEVPCDEPCDKKSSCYADGGSPLLLAGLHACGDLSVTMLRTFVECKEVKAVVSIGCCYNLLSEEGSENADSQRGFPMSKGIKSVGLSLGRSSRDLACHSAERWKCLGKDAGLHNFELHAFRAAFQMVLFRYYPEILMTSPSIGRQGKALRRQQQRMTLVSAMEDGEKKHSPLSLPQKCCKEGGWHNMTSSETETVKNRGAFEIPLLDACNSTFESCDAAGFASSDFDTNALFCGLPSNQSTEHEEINSVEKYLLFKKFSHSGLCRLGLQYLPDGSLAELWKETEPFVNLIGPSWSLRAAFGPVLETVVLLDRLLFLQEQGNTVDAIMLPIFDPALSPRNVALIAMKH